MTQPLQTKTAQHMKELESRMLKIINNPNFKVVSKEDLNYHHLHGQRQAIINFKNELKEMHAEECNCLDNEYKIPCFGGILIQEIEKVEHEK